MTWMLRPGCLLAIFSGLTFAGYGQSGEDQTGLLTVYVTTTLGGSVPGTVSIRSKGGESVYSAGTSSEITVPLQYGDYTVTFSGEFIQSVQRSVTIDGAKMFLVLAASLERTVLDFVNSPVSVSIKVHPYTACGTGHPLWAKLVGVFAEFSTERPISSGGFALFEPVDVGRYVVMVVDGQQVRATQSVTTAGPITYVDLKLTGCP